MRRLPFILVALAVVAFIAYSSMFIVNAREQALVLRFGEITRVVQQPGLYFKLPTNLVDSVQIIENRLLDFDLDNIRVQVRDGRRYLVDAFVAFKIVDPRKFRENVSGSIQVATENMRTRLDAALRRVYGQRSFEAALSEQRAEMMVEVRDQLRPLASDVGIDIVDVRIKRTDLLPEVSQQTFERMRAERLAEAAQLRARGTELAARIRAEADREAVVTVAEAKRDGDVLRGEGEADRSRIFAEAYKQDPNFFQFYRSMRAYESSLEGTGTTMVLSPDSEFFRYFKEASGGGPPDLTEPSDASASGDSAASGTAASGAASTDTEATPDAPKVDETAPALSPAPAAPASGDAATPPAADGAAAPTQPAPEAPAGGQ